MPAKKQITLNIRVDETLHTEMLAKAKTYFKGNLSALIRCASVNYSEKPVTTEPNLQINALIATAIRKIDKIGVNHNQIAKHINEKMKMSPMAFLSSDLQSFADFGNELREVKDILCGFSKMLNV